MSEPKVMTQVRGHPVTPTPEGWRYADGTLVNDDPSRPCVECGAKPVYLEARGWVDDCFIYMDDEWFEYYCTLPVQVTWACCGHGVEDGYIRWGNKPDHTTDALLVKE